MLDDTITSLRGPIGDDLLAPVAMFASLTAEMREQLVAQATPVHVKAGSWLFHEGDEGDSLYVLLSGRLDVVAHSPEPVVIRVLGRGDVLGELALLTGSPRSASVRARRDSELLKLARSDFQLLVSSQTGFVWALTRSLGEQLRNSSGRAIESPPIPTSIAIVPLHGGLPVRRLAEQIAAEIGRWHTVELMSRPDGLGDDGPSLASLLDQLERRARQVILLADDADAESEWTDFCLRSADLVLAVTAEQLPARWLDSLPTLRGCDVVYCSSATRHVDTVAWHQALAPRSTHLLSLDGDFENGARRIARRLARRSIGVVLSGGGARGLAHIGVLEELTRAGVVIDRVAGCSMGSFIGAQFASGRDPAEISARCHDELISRNPWSDYTIPLVAATRGRKLRAMLDRSFGAMQIQDLQRSYFCVSADLIKSELFVHDRGPVAAAVAASMCIPGSAPPLLMERRVLVDGGLFDNLPVETMASFGEGPIIAVDVTALYTPPSERPRGRARAQRLRAGLRGAIVGDDAIRPGLRETLFRAIVLGSRNTTEEAKRHADLVINPETAPIGLLAFKELNRARELGRQAARAALESSPDFFTEFAT